MSLRTPTPARKRRPLPPPSPGGGHQSSVCPPDGFGTQCSPVLVGLHGPTVVRLVTELKDFILAYRGPEDSDDLEMFLARAAEDVDSAFMVAIAIALLVGGQATAEAATRLLRKSESRERTVAVEATRPEAPTRALQDAEARLQTFLGGCGYADGYRVERRLRGYGGRMGLGTPSAAFDDGWSVPTTFKASFLPVTRSLISAAPTAVRVSTTAVLVARNEGRHHLPQPSKRIP